jgi:molybdate transport system regulatory protein
MIKVRANFWIEKDGEVVLSRWRVALLQAIDEAGSISAAAGSLGIPYRRAWDRVRECEERLGVKLIDTQTGGMGGGGAKLTPAGTEYVRRFQEFTSGLDEVIKTRFREAFHEMDVD